MKLKRTFFLLCISILFTNCSKSSESAFPELSFQVNFELLDQMIEFKELQFELGIPKDFVQLPDSQLTLLQEQIINLSEGKVPKYIPFNVFAERNGKGILVVSKVPSIEQSFVKFINEYNAAYQEYFPESETTHFSYKKINFWQGRRADSKKFVYFRFVFELNLLDHKIQIEYILPQTTNYGEVIESSIGSINNLNLEFK